jgi:hypothetical protein
VHVVDRRIRFVMLQKVPRKNVAPKHFEKRCHYMRTDTNDAQPLTKLEQPTDYVSVGKKSTPVTH